MRGGAGAGRGGTETGSARDFFRAGDELRDKIDKMDKKLDKVLEGFNELKLQSNKDDNQLELRLKAIETELALQKHTSLENHNRLTQIIAVVGVGLTIITILINVYFKMI